MILTTRDIEIKRILRRYYYARTGLICELVAPHLKDSSVIRGRMRGMQQEGWVRKHQPKLIDPFNPQSAAPIWVLTIKGSNVLAAQTGDCSLLLTEEPSFKDWMSLNHYCCLSSLHALIIDRAMAAQEYVRQRALLFEYELIDPKAEGGKKYRLHTTISTVPALYCCPDTAFETDVGGYRRAWFTEYETGSDGSPARVVAKKHKGYHALNAGKLYKRFFPEARDMRVLFFCPHEGWMQTMRSEMKEKPGAELFLFTTTAGLTPANFLHEPLFFTVDKGPLAFVPPPRAAAGKEAAGGGGV